LLTPDTRFSISNFCLGFASCMPSNPNWVRRAGNLCTLCTNMGPACFNFCASASARALGA
jgi:hypothetical protein